MIRSSSMSWHNFLASLILTNREIPLEYNLMTCLPNTFTFFSPFSVISCCLYSTYFLLIVLSLSLSTLSCVHLLPNKYPLLLSMTFFNSVRFYGAQCLLLVYQQYLQESRHQIYLQHRSLLLSMVEIAAR